MPPAASMATDLAVASVAIASFGAALAYVLPYWRRLALVVVLSLVSTALSLVLPYLSKILVDRALIGRDLTALYATVGCSR